MTVVIYKKTSRAKKVFCQVFEKHVDEILSSTKRKPLLDYKYEILEIGVGESFLESYAKKYKISDGN